MKKSDLFISKISFNIFKQIIHNILFNILLIKKQMEMIVEIISKMSSKQRFGWLINITMQSPSGIDFNGWIQQSIQSYLDVDVIVSIHNHVWIQLRIVQRTQYWCLKWLKHPFSSIWYVLIIQISKVDGKKTYGTKHWETKNNQNKL